MVYIRGLISGGLYPGGYIRGLYPGAVGGLYPGAYIRGLLFSGLYLIQNK